MKNWAVKMLVVLAVLLVVCLIKMYTSLKASKKEAAVYRLNTEVLMQDIDSFIVRDSLHATRVGALELKLSEYERYRAGDWGLIEDLKTRNKDLKSVTTARMATIRDIQAKIKDSIAYQPGDTAEKIVHKIDYSDKWLDFKAEFEHGRQNFEAAIQTRDSLLITELVQYKRFLGFLWKTSKVKKREFNIVSKNPYTKILGFEVIVVEK